MAPGKARKPLANWTWVRLGDTLGRLTNNNRTECTQGQRPNNHNDRTLDETENAEILEMQYILIKVIQLNQDQV